MIPSITWETSPASHTLTGDTVHVWMAELDLDPATMTTLERLLSENERARAARFLLDRDRNRFIAGRGQLRSILSRLTGLAAEEFRFSRNAYGKPALAMASCPIPLRFNLSHSHGLALYAATLGREIGIDLERLNPQVATGDIATRFFAPGEVARFRVLAAEHQTSAFFHCWTRKEAYIKAHGRGLSMPLDHFEVAYAPGEPAALLSDVDDPGAPARWSLHDLAVPDGYAGALAVEGKVAHVRCWRWTK